MKVAADNAAVPVPAVVEEIHHAPDQEQAAGYLHGGCHDGGAHNAHQTVQDLQARECLGRCEQRGVDVVEDGGEMAVGREREDKRCATDDAGGPETEADCIVGEEVDASKA